MCVLMHLMCYVSPSRVNPQLSLSSEGEARQGRDREIKDVGQLQPGTKVRGAVRAREREHKITKSLLFSPFLPLFLLSSRVGGYRLCAINQQQWLLCGSLFFNYRTYFPLRTYTPPSPISSVVFFCASCASFLFLPVSY